MILYMNKITQLESMCKIKFNHRGFIIVLIDKVSGDRISFYADLVSWKDAVSYAADMLSLKAYKDCGLYQITRCVDYEKNL